MACQITHPTGKPGGLSLAVLRLDAEPVAYLTLATSGPSFQRTSQRKTSHSWWAAVTVR